MLKAVIENAKDTFFSTNKEIEQKKYNWRKKKYETKKCMVS